MKISLLTKLATAILGLVILSNGSMFVLQHILYSNSFSQILGKVQQDTVELQRASAVDILYEISLATRGALARDDRSVFKTFAEKQAELKAIDEFSFYGRSRTIEDSSRQKSIGQSLDAAIWAKLQGSSDYLLVENDKNYEFYQPLFVDNDLHRLHRDWKVGEIFGILKLNVSKERINEMLTNANHEYQTKQSQVAAIVLGAIVVAVGLAFCIAFFLCKAMLRPLGNTVQAMERVAVGDYTQQVSITTKDEFARMATAVNTAVQSTAKAMLQVRQKTETLASFATQLSETATQLASGSAETTNQSAQVAAAAEQMSTNMGGMAASTEQMSANARTVALTVEQLTASISEVAKSAEQAAVVANDAAQLVSASNAQIADLGNAANEIGKVIEVIQDIAEQTNLLALNATIEAARAGDAGKGFAVVATEVKELAKQTAAATEGIRKRIEAIQGSTGETIKSIGGVQEIIHHVNELSRTIASAVEEQSATTKEIAKNVAQSSAVAETVARGVAESASASQEITKTIIKVDEAAKQASQGAAYTHNASEELSRMADQFQSMVSQFKCD